MQRPSPGAESSYSQPSLQSFPSTLIGTSLQLAQAYRSTPHVVAPTTTTTPHPQHAIATGQHQGIPSENSQHSSLNFGSLAPHSSTYERPSSVPQFSAVNSSTISSMESPQWATPDEWRTSLQFAIRQRPTHPTSSSSVETSLVRGSYHWGHAANTTTLHSTASTPTSMTGNQDLPDSIEVHPASIVRNEVVEGAVDTPNAHPPQSPQSAVRLAPVSTPENMFEYFPLSSESHRIFRERLLHVMNAMWRRTNQKEPDAQLLLQFTSKIEENHSERYQCLFWTEGSECGKQLARCDRMLEHLRRHVGVRPFTCDCKSEGCPGVFPSKAAMYQHQKNVEPVLCQRCGAQVLRQNLARHWRAQRCQRPEGASYVPESMN
ncbi:hypothetical protein FRC14_000274 [Serendipita sp. 396]|nr:hypothetical protein FRC14_000274 [Serendipita sp. 396]KAG8828542.1 hypothetical protein FRC19_003881 [Serendipita sp. 401]KAG8870180.1 hypothetical protein FRC20_000287 [Serendipita sp. 405]KAG9058588.1 hypothetical protein FS842_008010 [Serendipita sp. 407]